MPKLLSKKDAIAFLGLDEKTFENYFKNALEFPCLERVGKGRFYFEEETLKKWKSGLAWRTVELDKKDYALALDFALAMHFRSYVQSDFGTGRQREFGQKITNWVKGQLGEIAVKKFLKREFNIEVFLDLNVHDEIVPQDIVGILENGEVRPPHIGIGIKSSKPKNAFLILGANEITIPTRRSDVYIYVRPNIPDDHLLRVTNEQVVALVQNQPHYSSYKDMIPFFDTISCEIAGWCSYTELEEVTSIPGQEFEGGTRFVRPSGLLKKSKEDWQSLIKRL